jgi:Double zinc ribbon
MICPQCAAQNPESAHFCVRCHHMLLHQCPKCWHEQRTGTVCEECGTNFALYWELAFERSVERESRLPSYRSRAVANACFQLLCLPFVSLGGLLRSLIARLLSLRPSNR